MHPSYGSLIDGGLDDYGVYQPSVIGTNNWERVALKVESEIRRICSEYQRAQLERARQDRYRYGESTLTKDELLLQVSDIKMLQAQDQLLVTVSIITGGNSEVQLDLPLDNTGVFL